MIEFIASPMYENWLKKNVPSKSLIYVTPYIKRDAVDRIFQHYPKSCEIKLLIRGNNEEFTYNHSSDIEALYYFHHAHTFDDNNLRRLQNLHMKAYLVDGSKLLVTSGNFTANGMFLGRNRGNAEGGIATDELNVVQSFLEYFQKLWKRSQPMPQFLDSVQEAYKKYIKATQGQLVQIPRERKKYTYHTENVRCIDSHVQADTGHKFMLKAIPARGSIDDLPLTLRVLDENDAISSPVFGNIMRNEHGKRAVDKQSLKKEKEADSKLGEECSKLAAYLGLVDIEKRKTNILTITGLGKQYLQADELLRKTMIWEQISHKEFFQSLVNEFSAEEISKMAQGDKVVCQNLREYIFSNVQAKESTLKRVIPTCRELLVIFNREH